MLYIIFIKVKKLGAMHLYMYDMCMLFDFFASLHHKYIMYLYMALTCVDVLNDLKCYVI